MPGFRLPSPVEKVFRRMSHASKAISQTANTSMDGAACVLDPEQAPLFVEGTIVRSGVGWYDLAVNISDRGLIGCCMLTNMASNLYGVSESALPIEGSRVLVYMPSRNIKYGTVVGVIPNRDFMPPTNAERTTSLPAYASFFNLESYGSVGSEIAYHRPLSDVNNPVKVNANATRPLDVLPGTYVLQNDQLVGMAITPLAATLKANSRAQVRVSLVDDNVRIVSGFFQHYNAAGVMQTYNDEGYITEENSVSSYQCERSGMNSIGTKIFDPDATLTLPKRSKVTSLKKKARATSRKRLQSFTGFLGDIVNLFIAKPDPDIDVPETEDSKNKDQGLFHSHIDASGRLLIRSANGIQLQRWDRIPVPKRIRQPWDPAGDNGFPEPPAKLPFQWPDGHPYGRSLQLRDANAWRYLSAYWHLHNQSESTGKKDFYIPEENELRHPDNEYDVPGKGKEEYGKYDKRQSGLSLEEDGSIVIRDAWGSEIIMRGGNIILNAAGQIDVRSGKSTVIMAGSDAVVRGRYSVDINATERDVRIKADRNLHMMAEGRNGGGSILLESKADGDGGQWDPKGESVLGKGIVLKAAKSRVLTTANTVHVSGQKAVMIEGFGQESGDNDGQILMSASTIHSNSKRRTHLTSGKEAALLLTQSSGFLVGQSVSLVGGRSTRVLRGMDIMIPLLWAPSGGNVYSEMQPIIIGIEEYLQGTAWLEPYTPTQRRNVRFTYRSSLEYGTLRGTEVYQAEKFYVYQPFWAFMAKSGSEFVPARPEAWTEYEIEGTKPWPGKDANAGSYVKLEQEMNVDSTTGIAKKRTELNSTPGALSPTSFDEYEVLAHQ